MLIRHAYRVRFHDGRIVAVPAELFRTLDGRTKFFDLGDETIPPRVVAEYATDAIASIETYDVTEERPVLVDVA